MSAAFFAALAADTFGGDDRVRPHTSGDERTEEDANDRALVARIVQGDETAFGDLMAEYFPRLSRFAYGMLGAPDIADDIAQDVLARVWERRASWRPERSIDAYLYGAARNAALNELKRRAVRVRANVSLTESIEATAMPTDNVIDRLSVDSLIAALRVEVERLPERRRTALRLRYEEGLTYPAMAGVLGVSVKSAEQLVTLTIQMLRKALRRLR